MPAILFPKQTAKGIAVVYNRRVMGVLITDCFVPARGARFNVEFCRLLSVLMSARRQRVIGHASTGRSRVRVAAKAGKTGTDRS